MQKHIISLLVDNEPGVLARVAGLFCGRGFNIESLCVADTTDASISRITLVTRGDEAIAEQIKKQLNKLINVIKLYDLTGTDYVEREMALVKVKAKDEHRAEVLRIVDIFRCKVVDVGPTHYTIEVTGTVEKLLAVSAQPRDTLLQHTSALRSQQVAVSELTALVIGIQLAIDGLSTSQRFDDKKVTSSDETLLSAVGEHGHFRGTVL